MNVKTLLGLGLVAAILVLAGLLFVEGDAPPAGTAVEGERVFPGLYDRVNEIESLTVATPDGEFTIQRQDDAWGLAERAGYPVVFENVRSTLVGLAELELVERKTDNPDLYGKLGAQPVTPGDSSETPARSLTARGPGGEVLAALIVGKARQGGTGATYFARKPGEAASWLVSGDRPQLPDSGDDWLDKKILEVQRSDVRAGRIVHADGEVVSLAKEDADTDYGVLELPADRELKYASVAGSVAGSMQYLNFEDVKPIADFERPEVATSVVHLWTRDGMRVTAEVFALDDETTWAVFGASYDAEGAPALPAPVGPVPGDEPVAQASATPRPEAEVRAEAAALDARVSPWAYQLPQYSRANFTKRLEDLLKPLPEETEDEGTAGDASPLDALEGAAPPADGE